MVDSRAAVCPMRVPAPARCPSEDGCSSSNGLVPGPRSWVGILLGHLGPCGAGRGGGAVLLRADESIQECDVCGRPKPHSHS